MRRLWPTAAAACLCGRLLGYSGSPSFSMPHTMAPEETITISRPCAFNVARSLASWSMRSVFRPLPLEATRRSEERRVGKEGRAQGGEAQESENKQDGADE